MAKKKKDDPRPIFWITGNYYDCRRHWEQICTALDEEPSIHTVECGYNPDTLPKELHISSAVDIVLMLKNKDLFDDRPRIIRMLGIPPDYALLYDYLYLVNNNNILVLYGPLGYYAPHGNSLRLVTAKSSNLYKQLNKWGRVFDLPIEEKTDRKAMDWVTDVFGDLKRDIERDAVKHLVEVKGRNLDVLYSDITTLCQCIEERAITKEDIDNVCVPVFTKTVWDLLDMIDMGNYEASLSSLHSYLDIAGALPGKSFHGDVRDLIGSWKRHFTFLTLAKTKANNGLVTLQHALDAVKGIKRREKKEGKYVWDRDIYEYYAVKKSMESLPVQNALERRAGQLHDCMRDIYRCELFCRANSSNEKAQALALSACLMVLCQKISCAQATRMRGKILGRMV